jgi:hypothetical protein
LLGNPRYAASLRVLAASFALRGEREKAAEALKRYLAVDPNASVSTLRVRLGYLCDEVWNRLADGVRLAGSSCTATARF